MKLRFWWFRHPTAPVDSRPWARASIFERQEDHENSYNSYLCSFLSGDLQTVSTCHKVLELLQGIEKKEIKSAPWAGNGWFIDAAEDCVAFELQTADDHPDWPVRYFTLAEVKAAVRSWKQFLAMPVDIESHLEVELPPRPESWSELRPNTRP
jgi:hypothetical protein